MGYISLIGCVLVVLSSLVLITFVVSLGMACSLASRTTYRATVATILALLGITMGHWLLYLIGSAFAEILGWTGLRETLATFHLYGMTPPVTISTLASIGRLKVSDDVALNRYIASCAGTLVYALMAWGLWRWLQSQFPVVTGRIR